MKIKIERILDKTIGNLRVDENTFLAIEKCAKEQDVSPQIIVRAILVKAVSEGLEPTP